MIIFLSLPKDEEFFRAAKKPDFSILLVNVEIRNKVAAIKKELDGYKSILNKARAVTLWHKEEYISRCDFLGSNITVKEIIITATIMIIAWTILGILNNAGIKRKDVKNGNTENNDVYYILDLSIHLSLPP